MLGPIHPEFVAAIGNTAAMGTQRGLQLTGRPDRVRISATDVANADACPRHLALKTRPDLKPADWSRTFGDVPFPLGDVLNLFELALRRDVQPADAVLWVRQQVDLYGIHRLLRPYVRHALLNVLEAHWTSADELGAFTSFVRNPAFGPTERSLTVFGFVHATDDGVREVRRYRIGSARPPGDAADARWAHTASRVAAGVPFGASVTRVRVVEVGLVDGDIEVHFDGTRDEAVAAFVDGPRSTAQSLGDLQVAVPGYDCGSCKAAGVCDALIDVSGALCQTEPGHRTRSVSAAQLDRYRTCPAQWLLHAELHLPRTEEVSEAQQRGMWVHQWLEHAHRAGRCDLNDRGPLDEHEFATAFPFLAHHVATCPLATDEVEFIAAEDNVHGYDESADVVCVAKPDLIYRVGDRVVVREFKTAAHVPLGGPDDVFGRTVQVPLLITLLASGLADAFGGRTATVEVEVLTPEASQIYAWDVDDATVLAQARSRVADAVTQWHADAAWDPTPGAHCQWCPVREWCPDADQAPSAAIAAPAGDSFDPVPDDEPPPF